MPKRNFYIKNYKATNNCIFWFSILCNYFVQDMERGGGGGTPHMKGVGMLVGNFELNP